MYPLLNTGGKILIGDVAFLEKENLLKCKNDNLDIWDNDEIYMIFQTLKKNLSSFNPSFEKISHCSGILYIEK